VLRWHVQLGNVVIPKSTTPSRIGENIAVFDFELNDAEMAALGSRREPASAPTLTAGTRARVPASPAQVGAGSRTPEGRERSPLPAHRAAYLHQSREAGDRGPARPASRVRQPGRTVPRLPRQLQSCWMQ
jgi:hypothetical protein